MSLSKPVVAFGYPPTLHFNPSQSRVSSKSSSASFAIIKHQSLFLGKTGLTSAHNIRRVPKDDKNRRSFVVYNVVQPAGVPPPFDGSPFNFLNCIVGVVFTVVLPFISRNWGPLLKIKNEVETAVHTAEVIVHAVEKVAEEVEKAAEEIADDLPEGGSLRKVVDFVENAAEIASKDAHLVGDFIDKVQEAEEKVEACVESLAEEVAAHEHPKEEDKPLEQPKEINNEEQEN